MENFIYGLMTGLVASLIGFVIYSITSSAGDIPEDNDWVAEQLNQTIDEEGERQKDESKK